MAQNQLVIYMGSADQCLDIRMGHVSYPVQDRLALHVLCNGLSVDSGDIWRDRKR